MNQIKRNLAGMVIEAERQSLSQYKMYWELLK